MLLSCSTTQAIELWNRLVIHLFAPKTPDERLVVYIDELLPHDPLFVTADGLNPESPTYAKDKQRIVEGNLTLHRLLAKFAELNNAEVCVQWLDEDVGAWLPISELMDVTDPVVEVCQVRAAKRSEVWPPYDGTGSSDDSESSDDEDDDKDPELSEARARIELQRFVNMYEGVDLHANTKLLKQKVDTVQAFLDGEMNPEDAWSSIDWLFTWMKKQVKSTNPARYARMEEVRQWFEDYCAI